MNQPSPDITAWLEMVAKNCEADHMPEHADGLRSAKAEIERLRTGVAQGRRWPSDGEMLGLLAAAGFDTQLTHPSCYYAFSWKTFTEKLKTYSMSSTGQREPMAWCEKCSDWHYPADECSVTSTDQREGGK